MAIFPEIFNMSLSASVVILVVMTVRLLLKRTPKIFSYTLWAVVLFRLLCPITLESPISAMPELPQITAQTVDAVLPELPFVTPDDSAQNQHDIDNVVMSHTVSPDVWMTGIWLAGVGGMLLWSMIAWLRLRRRLVGAMHLQNNIYLADHIASPFVLGLVRPKIYLPSNMECTPHILLHEQHHIRRMDHWVKVLAFLALTLHWFNPLVWLAFHLAGQDMEMSCDEAVIRQLGQDIRGDYAASLLQISTGKTAFSGMPLAFGEGSTKGRIRNLSNWKKPVAWILAVTVVLCAAVAVCFAFDRADRIRSPWVQEYVPGQGNIRGNVDTEKYLAVSEDFAIGAAKNGTAVFKDPKQAFATLQRLYPDAIEHIQNEFGLDDFADNWQDYKVLGMQVTSGSEQERERARFVAGFLDIYENSFLKENSTDVRPTISLEAHISAAVLAHHRSHRSEGRICVESHELLSSETRDSGNMITVYLLVLYEEYGLYDDEDSASGSYVPTAITFDLRSNAVLEYWEPRDGAYYSSDIREKFPATALLRAMNDQKYIEKLQAENREKVRQQKDWLGDPDEMLGEIIAKICTEPAWSSNPGDYIDAHPDLYDKLLTYGQYTMQYCFGRFLQGNEIGLEGHIMALACKDILASWQEEPNLGIQMTGQDWFDAFYAAAKELAEELPEEDLQKYHPGSWLLLELTA